jgi:hypothetical protein
MEVCGLVILAGRLKPRLQLPKVRLRGLLPDIATIPGDHRGRKDLRDRHEGEARVREGGLCALVAANLFAGPSRARLGLSQAKPGLSRV